MDDMVDKLPVIVIVGPTASGKTSLAVEIAVNYDCEIICADSRTIYKGMDIGTAKPTLNEQKLVPHWGIDLVDPGDKFNVKNFHDYASRKILEIQGRGRTPLVVGGTGLYVDSLLFDFRFNGDNTSWRTNIKENMHVVGITTDKINLRRRINKRAIELFNDGVVNEASKLADVYSWDLGSMTSNIYQIVKLHLEGKYSVQESIEKITTLDWKLAKRQMTWFRPNPYIEWCTLHDAYALTSNILSDRKSVQKCDIISKKD
ncbi:tRNA (adenosine(37)-N6)-dimethylallyltransferase MiaA [Candidatus Saccharibacteria bacterium]|nr:tRNA (adenosine(37)-N6)-dimethylallyltransferase MiaA [Candidatus Saccharibacteria bacterium]